MYYYTPLPLNLPNKQQQATSNKQHRKCLVQPLGHNAVLQPWDIKSPPPPPIETSAVI